MSEDQERLRELFRRYLENNIEAAEYDQLWKLLEKNQQKDVLPGELQALWEDSARGPAAMPGASWDQKMKQVIEAKEETENKKTENKETEMPQTRGRSFAWKVAAAIALLLATGLYFYRHDRMRTEATQNSLADARDIRPGGDKAILTLADGSHIVLDTAADGMLVRQGNTAINVAEGILAYQAGGTDTSSLLYNTLTTPRGGKFRLTLADGSKVWLNSASSITFPTDFGPRQRTVQISGEAYFEVAHDKAKPFEVQVGDLVVQVLGTHFNIMAYPEESGIETTLLEGAVNVKQGNAEVFLKPGQQARVDEQGTINLLPHVATEQVLAWKNELFWFDKTDIGTVMRQLARWYDVEVEITGPISRHFSGTLPRTENVSKIFEVLEETGGIHFTIENRKIIVSP